jgi:hypothetical protein
MTYTLLLWYLANVTSSRAEICKPLHTAEGKFGASAEDIETAICRLRRLLLASTPGFRNCGTRRGAASPAVAVE